MAGRVVQLVVDPITIVMSSLEAGAEMMTFLAPASMCACALVASVKKPVDSTTTSAPMSPHLRLPGSRSANAAISWSPTLMVVSVDVTSASRRPRIVSNLSRRARVLLSVRSLTPTISMSAPDARTARKKLRPIRPKPLMPTRTVMVAPWSLSRAFGHPPDGRSRAFSHPRFEPSRTTPRRAGASVVRTGNPVRPRRRASPASATPRCRGCRGPRPACRPSPAAGGSAPRWRPW